MQNQLFKCGKTEHKSNECPKRRLVHVVDTINEEHEDKNKSKMRKNKMKNTRMKFIDKN